MKHPRDVLHREIALVDSKLERPVTVYLIGGGAMSFQDLKDATKDIDGILESPEDLGATRIYAKHGAPQWDLFIQVVCRKLRLSPGRRVPILADVERLAQEELDEWAVLEKLKEPRTPEQLVETLQEYADEDVQGPVLAAVERLAASGRLVRDEEQVRRNPDWLPS